MSQNKRYNLPIPFGWYAVSPSGELENGAVKALHYFDRELVLFRTESGEAKVLDAFCPHLGAHLGHGGSVVGESIACPFHGWQFSGEGMCEHIPYAEKKPAKVVDQACIRHYPTREDNHAIWVWYHPQDKAPQWPLEHIPEMFDLEYWSETHFREWVVNCHIQDTNENGVDKAHFAYVHTSPFVPSADVKVDGHRRVSEVQGQSQAFDETGTPIKDQFMAHSFISKSWGPGFTWQRFQGATDTMMMGTITPISQEQVHMRFFFRYPKPETDMAALFTQGYMDEMCRQVEQDIQIWNYKCYQPNPILCDGDGPIHQYRKWFSQFYVE
ncbi:MAG: Rieske 2Fe-2S domain-containing protein [Pseudomonadales bacterium]|nr:Rieske 2Fe-2S domain-containing protein [Pseudomonadales bacterium]